MVTMLAIMKDTDDHFKEVSEKLDELKTQYNGKPNLKLVKGIDNDK
jgi:hypothetical protein